MNPIFENRHSTKAFLDKKVEQEKIDEVIQAGLLAPSGKNSQSAVIVCITNEEIVKKLSSLNKKIGGFPENIDPFYGSRAVLLVMAKKVNTAVYDGSLVMGNLLNAAESLGLGSIWIHRAKEEIESEEGKKILSSLNLDLDEYVGIGHVVLGYMKSEPVAKKVNDGRVFYLK